MAEGCKEPTLSFLPVSHEPLRSQNVFFPFEDKICKCFANLDEVCILDIHLGTRSTYQCEVFFKQQK